LIFLQASNSFSGLFFCVFFGGEGGVVDGYIRTEKQGRSWFFTSVNKLEPNQKSPIWRSIGLDKEANMEDAIHNLALTSKPIQEIFPFKKDPFLLK